MRVRRRRQHVQDVCGEETLKNTSQRYLQQSLDKAGTGHHWALRWSGPPYHEHRRRPARHAIRAWAAGKA